MSVMYVRCAMCACMYVMLCICVLMYATYGMYARM